MVEHVGEYAGVFVEAEGSLVAALVSLAVLWLALFVVWRNHRELQGLVLGFGFFSSLVVLMVFFYSL